MTEEAQEMDDKELLIPKIRFAACRLVYILIEKSRFLRMDEKLRAYATSATPEVLIAAGRVSGNELRQVRVFTSESEFFAGRTALQEGQEGRKVEYINIAAPPSVLLEVAPQLRMISIEVNAGLEGSYLVEAAGFDELRRLVLIARLSQLDYLYVLESRAGLGIPFDVDGEEYAACFVSEEQGADTLRQLEESNPGVRLARNKTLDVVDGVLASDYSGLVFDPAGESQAFLPKSELEKLKIAADILRKPPLLSVRTLKHLFGLG